MSGGSKYKAFAGYIEGERCFGVMMFFGESGFKKVDGATKEQMVEFNKSAGNTDADIHAALICAENDAWPMFEFYKRSYKSK